MCMPWFYSVIFLNVFVLGSVVLGVILLYLVSSSFCLSHTMKWVSLETNLYRRPPRLCQQQSWTPGLCHTFHSGSSLYAKTEGGKQRGARKPAMAKSASLWKTKRQIRGTVNTFPAPRHFSAAYTVFWHLGQTSAPSALWANFEALGLFVGRWGACLFGEQEKARRKVEYGEAAWNLRRQSVCLGVVPFGLGCWNNKRKCGRPHGSGLIPSPSPLSMLSVPAPPPKP